MQHFWSLAVEEQFYLVFPVVTALVLRATARSRRSLAATLAALTAFSVARMLTLAPSDAPTARAPDHAAAVPPAAP